MLVCNVSLRPPRAGIAADLAEITAAVDTLLDGIVGFATQINDPASASETVDAYLGVIMLEAASASDTVSTSSVYDTAINEAVTANDAASIVVGFTPAVLTGLVGWWDASIAASLSLTGSDINSVADQSGLGNTLNWSNGKPTYNATGLNSRPAIIFGGAQGLQATPFPMGTGNTLTFWWVGTAGTAGSGSSARLLSYMGGGASADHNNAGSWLVLRQSATQPRYWRNNSAILDFTCTADPAVHRFIATVNSSGLIAGYCDGVQTGFPGPVGGNWLDSGTFGVGRSPVGDYFAGPFGEVGVTTDLIDATTIGALDTYLKTKWGL